VRRQHYISRDPFIPPGEGREKKKKKKKKKEEALLPRQSLLNQESTGVGLSQKGSLDYNK
jgi:hypothetical protein